jgi:hypothetical protein
MKGCSGNYRIVSRTNWVNFQNGAPLIGGGFCPTCRRSQREREAAVQQKRQAEYAAQLADDAARDALIEALIARLGLTQSDVDEIYEFVVRKRDRERDEEYYREMGGEE